MLSQPLLSITSFLAPKNPSFSAFLKNSLTVKSCGSALFKTLKKSFACILPFFTSSLTSLINTLSLNWYSSSFKKSACLFAVCKPRFPSLISSLVSSFASNICLAFKACSEKLAKSRRLFSGVSALTFSISIMSAKNCFVSSMFASIWVLTASVRSGAVLS